MSHIDPAVPVSWWKQILSWEPVAVQAVVRAIFVLAANVGLNLSTDIEPRVLGGIMAFYALVEVVTTLVARKRVTPDSKVLERVEHRGESFDDVVVAGPANELESPGVVVRTYGG